MTHVLLVTASCCQCDTQVLIRLECINEATDYSKQRWLMWL